METTIACGIFAFALASILPAQGAGTFQL